MGRPRGKKSRIYWRNGRAYGDFRDFKDVGGGQEALRPPGAKVATKDADVARKLVSDRVAELEERRRNKALLGVERQATLRAYASHHLVEKKRSGKVSTRWLDGMERCLRRAVGFLGAGRDLMSISVRDMQQWATWLSNRPNGRGRRRCPECGKKVARPAFEEEATASCERCGERWPVDTLSPGTVRHHLNAVSNLFRRAASEGYVAPGYNPVAAMMDKPTPRREEAAWLEIDEAALLLESARTWDPDADAGAAPFIHPLVATFLLTGGRKSEVLGLAVEDVSFDRRTVTFRPHPWRRLKTRTSHRSVPLWPQLEEILREHVFGGEGPRTGMLFPSNRTGKMLDNVDRALDAIGERVGWSKGDIRTKMFRHTYTAARLQTLDRGHPVSVYTVAKELGHGGDSMVKRVYGHLGQVRHRSETVEYRVEQHEEELGERVRRLRAGVR